MGYTIRVNHPHFSEGTEFGVGTFGTIPNGSSKEISEDEERHFIMARGLPVEEAFAGDSVIEVTGSSALDKSEVNSILEFFSPATSEVEETETSSASPDNDTSSDEEEGGES